MIVIVNPNYGVEGWYDPKSKISFLKSHGEIEVPDDVDKTNIDRYIRLNYLFVATDNTVKEQEEKTELIAKTPAQLLAEDEPKEETPEEVVEEEVVEEEPSEVAEPEAEVEKTEVEESEAEVEEEPAEVDKHLCDYCGKELKTAAGKSAHERSCKENLEK